MKASHGPSQWTCKQENDYLRLNKMMRFYVYHANKIE
jgi:hypothetical protein